MTFELWDTESGNLLAVYPSKGTALTFVKTVVDDGLDAVEQWELLAMHGGQSAESIEFGEEMAALSHRRGPRPA